jgi:hypothetical protein
MRSFTTLWVLALLPFGACTEVTGPPLGTVPVEVTVRTWPGIPERIEDMELCPTDDTSRCKTTDANGEATLWLPVGETSFTLRKQGYNSYVVPIDNPENGSSHDFFLIRDELTEKLYNDVMAEWPLGDLGRITCDMKGLAGVTFKLFDAAGEEPDTVKQYYRESGESGPSWSVELTATTIAGEGGFVEVPPGEYVIELGGEAVDLDCVPIWGWSAFRSNSVRFPVQAGYATALNVACSEKRP